MNKGLIGLLGLLIFVICIAAGFVYIQTHPVFKAQLESEITAFREGTATTGDFTSPLALARDQERRESVKAITDAIFLYTSENKGLLPIDFPTEEICIGTDNDCYDLGKVLVPTFLSEIPKDPQIGNDANTGFTTYKNSDGRVVVGVKGENGGEFEIVR